MDYLVYAVYGSNLLRERFLAYIKGGEFEGREYSGCTDKTKPEDLGWRIVPYRLYFAKRSPRWDDKGVAFLSCEEEPNPEYHTVVRLWKIKQSQFECIWEQEGRGFYHKKLTLGEIDGMKIVTITGCHYQERNEPSERYLNVIRRGLKETTGWDDEKIEDYLRRFI